MPETTAITQTAGTLFFDGTCALCVRWINRIRPILNRREIQVKPFADGASESEMRLAWADGREFGGADAAIFLCGKIWWSWPVRVLAFVPGVRPLFHKIYRRIADNRHCRNGACEVAYSPAPPAKSEGYAPFQKCAYPWPGWLALVLLTSLALLAGTVTIPAPIQEGWISDHTLSDQKLPAWLWMWLLAGALWVGFKLIAWLRVGTWQTLGARSLFFAAWVGMDAGSFVEKTAGRKLPVGGALLRITTGVLLIGGLAPAIDSPVLRGWAGMAGILLILHFGCFEIAAAGWNRRGYLVRPIMDAPWRARALGDFWGERWNRAFSEIARSSIFRPLVRRLGVPAGTLAGFAFSGLAHELVISVPATGGYGLPTAYFMIQGFGVLAERKFKLRKTTAGRFFLWLVILGPAFGLFHPPFMTAVIDPFLDVLTFTDR